MGTQKDKWERIEREMIIRYLPKLKKLLQREDLVLEFVPIEINKRKNMKRMNGCWDGKIIELYKNHQLGLSKEILVHEMLHVFISQNKLEHLNRKSQLFNKLVLNLSTPKFNIVNSHGAYLWKYKCECGWWIKTNTKRENGWECSHCGYVVLKPTQYVTKEITL